MKSMSSFSDASTEELKLGGGEFMLPDFIEIECTKTKMYKIIAEGFCYKSPEYSLAWKVSPCKVDLEIKSSLRQKQGPKLENQIKHEATLHSLRFVPRGDAITNKLSNVVSNNYLPIPEEGLNTLENLEGYKPPSVYDISSRSDRAKNSIDIDSVDNIEDFRQYIQANIV